MIDPNATSALIGLGGFAVGLLGYRLATDQGRRADELRKRDEERKYHDTQIELALSRHAEKWATAHRHLGETVNTALNVVIEVLQSKRSQHD